jgi:hypothetical protein
MTVVAREGAGSSIDSLEVPSLADADGSSSSVLSVKHNI